MCKTLCNNYCYQLTITSRKKDKKKEKEGVVIIARQHPGETVGSYVVQGLISFLLSDHPLAKSLREIAIFKIVPMMNPDGVIHGHYRTTLLGEDPNRQWPNLRSDMPALLNLKKMLLKFT